MHLECGGGDDRRGGCGGFEGRDGDEREGWIVCILRGDGDDRSGGRLWGVWVEEMGMLDSVAMQIRDVDGDGDGDGKK